MKNFIYYRPKTIIEATTLIHKYVGKATILAGGTDLLVDLKKRVKYFSHIIDIKGIPSLDSIGFDSEGNLKIGSLVTMQALSTHPDLVHGYKTLAKAASKLGSWQIRNRATIGGNICRASPSGETLPSLFCLNAELKLMSLKGERRVPIENFFLEPGKSAAMTDEILSEIIIPQIHSKSYGTYKKFAVREAMDLAVVGVAVVGSLDPRGESFEDIRIGLGAVAPTPVRAKKTEAFLIGKKIREDLIAEAASLASTETRPISDVRASDWYRFEMVKMLVKEAIHEILILLRGRR
jgi:carbon-monoxide dehydrogenase medium subunit